MRVCTNKGTVVYKRKKHLFTCRDVERIASKVENLQVLVIPPRDKNNVFGTIEESVTPIETALGGADFGGGRFGGGGVSGGFDYSETVGIFILIEGSC